MTTTIRAIRNMAIPTQMDTIDQSICIRLGTLSVRALSLTVLVLGMIAPEGDAPKIIAV